MISVLKADSARWESLRLHRALGRPLSEPKTAPETIRVMEEVALTRYGNIPVHVWSNSKNTWLRTDAVADTGCLGDNANLVSIDFLTEDLQHYFIPSPSDERVSFHGLGGKGFALGSVKLKIQKIGRNQKNELVREDISRPTFFVVEDNSFDILLGREFLENNIAFRPYWGQKGTAKKEPQSKSG